VPWFAERSVAKGENTKYHAEHLEERMGLLTIIVLGESILASVNAFDSVFNHFTPELGLIVSGALLILFSMWWLYFDDKVEQELHNETTCFIWSYGHYFIFGAAAAVGALISVCVDAASVHGHITMDKAVLGLAIALSIYLIAIWLCHDFILKKTGIVRFELLILATVVLVLAIATNSILLIGLAFVTLNVFRLWRRHKGFKQLNS